MPMSGLGGVNATTGLIGQNQDSHPIQNLDNGDQFLFDWQNTQALAQAEALLSSFDVHASHSSSAPGAEPAGAHQHQQIPFQDQVGDGVLDASSREVFDAPNAASGDQNGSDQSQLTFKARRARAVASQAEVDEGPTSKQVNRSSARASASTSRTTAPAPPVNPFVLRKREAMSKALVCRQQVADEMDEVKKSLWELTIEASVLKHLLPS